MKKYKLTTGYLLIDTNENGDFSSEERKKQYLDAINNLALVSLEGSEEEIVYKMNRNLLAIFAQYYSSKNKTDIKDELIKLTKKYNLKLCGTSPKNTED